jgi:hypothetical protein
MLPQKDHKQYKRTTAAVRKQRFSFRSGSRESGQTLLLVVAALTGILVVAAFAIDVVTLYTFRSEAQRSADAAALAGAKLFVDSGFTSGQCPPPATVPSLQTLITQQATAIAHQNTVGGASASFAVNVNFPNAASPSCANPQVTVGVQRTNLPIYFARIWSRTPRSVRATATAEAYNPSAATSAGGGASAPVAPRCVKPLLLPNCDPTSGNASSPPSLCGGGGGGGAATFVNPTTGAVSNPSVIGTTPSTPMTADCARSRRGSPCAANAPAAWQYYPLALPPATNACPNCSSPSSGFQNNLECCNPTPLACGQTLSVDFSLNPNGRRGAARTGGQCAIHQSGGGGQDWLDTSTSPFQMHAGSSNPFLGSNSQTNIQRGDVISSSNSIVTVPLYDGAPVAGAVTIVGFLQLFVNDVSNSGQMDATILNVIGCGQATGAPVLGAGSPIPVRLIHN